MKNKIWNFEPKSCPSPLKEWCLLGIKKTHLLIIINLCSDWSAIFTLLKDVFAINICIFNEIKTPELCWRRTRKCHGINCVAHFMQYSATYLLLEKQNFCCIHNKHGVGMKLIMKQAHIARWRIENNTHVLVA